MLNTGHEPEPFHPFNAPDDCAMSVAALLAAGAKLEGLRMNSGPNTYDVTTWDKYAMIQHGNQTLERFYNNPLVKAKLHAPEQVAWRGCIEGAGRRRRLESSSSRNLLLLDHDRP